VRSIESACDGNEAAIDAVEARVLADGRKIEMYNDREERNETVYVCAFTLSFRPPMRTPLSSCFCAGRDWR